jgi:membrane-bound lytic murein transglycosylase F
MRPYPWLQTTLIGLSLLLSGCNPSSPLPDWSAGKLVVVVPQHTQGAEVEFERSLVALLGDFLHTKIVLLPESTDNIAATLQTHRAHLAAAPMRSAPSHPSLRFGPTYQSVREQMVCNNSAPTPRTLADLSGKRLAVASGSAQLAALQEAQQNFPALRWQSRARSNTLQLLSEVSEEKLDCAVANELQFTDARNYAPNLVAAFDIAPPSRLAWAFPKDADPLLIKQIEAFFAKLQREHTLQRLLDHYYGHNNRLTQVDAAAFISAIQTVLPHYRTMFEEAGTITGEDWRLLAALAYQESQWDPLATSYTNVRGMMMLTEETADRMELDNRLDARTNIIAGARYLVLLKEQLPERIHEPDRTWLALAAYNQGLGHLEDARVLTDRAKQNPDSWLDVKKWMLRLNQEEIYDTVKHGYARGGEAVALVENIRNYHAILRRLEPDRPSLTAKLTKPLRNLLR